MRNSTRTFYLITGLLTMSPWTPQQRVKSSFNLAACLRVSVTQGVRQHPKPAGRKDDGQPRQGCPHHRVAGQEGWGEP